MVNEPFTVARFIEMATELDGRVPDSCELTRNQVGNLTITDRAGKYLGYIDLRFGRIEYWGDE